MDDVLINYSLANDRSVPTRGNNVLDITLANNNAYENIVKHKVLLKLNSDHNPTKTYINLDKNPVFANGGSLIKDNEIQYIILGIQETQRI